MAKESRFALRLPSDLYEVVRMAAGETGRSINEYIVFVLSDYHRMKDDFARQMQEINERLERLERRQT